MSKKQIKNDVERQLEGDFPAELGPALSALGDTLTKQWWEENGVYLSKAERASRNSPISSVGDMNIKIDTGYGKTFVLSQYDPNKPSVVIPVGMTDKVTTATRPNDWIVGFLLACIQEMAQDDYRTVGNIMDAVNRHIDVATEIVDDKKKIVQSKLPSVKNSNAISGFISSLKRTFVSRCRGYSQLNLKMDLVDTNTSISKPLDLNEVVVPIVVKEATFPTTPVVIEPFIDFNEVVVPRIDPVVPDAVIHDESNALISRMVLENQIIASVSEESTVGMIRKSMAEFGVDEAVWRPRFDAMVKSGIVGTNGLDRRAKRYIVESKEVKA